MSNENDLSADLFRESPIRPERPPHPDDKQRETEDEQPQDEDAKETNASLEQQVDGDAVRSGHAGSPSISPSSPDPDVSDTVESSIPTAAEPEVNDSISPIKPAPALESRYDQVSDYSISSESESSDDSISSASDSSANIDDELVKLKDLEVEETVEQLSEAVQGVGTEELPESPVQEQLSEAVQGVGTEQLPESPVQEQLSEAVQAVGTEQLHESPEDDGQPSPSPTHNSSGKAESPDALDDGVSDDGVPKTFAMFSVIDPKTGQRRSGLGKDYKYNYIRLIIPNLDTAGRTATDITIAIDPQTPVEEHTHCYILWPCHGQPPTAVFTGCYIWMEEIGQFVYQCRFEHMRGPERQTYETSFVPSSRLARILPTMPRPLKVKSRRSVRVVPVHEGWEEFKSPDHLPLDAVVPGQNPGEYFKVLNHSPEYKGVCMQQCDPTNFKVLCPKSNWQLWFYELDFPKLTAEDMTILRHSLATDDRRNSATGLQLKPLKQVKSRVRNASEPPVASKELVDNLYDSAPLNSKALLSQLVSSADSSTSDIDDQPRTRRNRTKSTAQTKQITKPGQKQVPSRVRKPTAGRSQAKEDSNQGGLPQPATQSAVGGDSELMVLMQSQVDETANLRKEIAVAMQSASSGASPGAESDPETRRLLVQQSATLEDLKSKVAVLGADKDRNEEVRVLNQKLAEAREALVSANSQIREKEAIILVEGNLLKEQASTQLIAREKDIKQLNKKVLELTEQVTSLKKELAACQEKLESWEVTKLGLETQNNTWQEKHEQLQQEVGDLHKQLIEKEAALAILSRQAVTSENSALSGLLLTRAPLQATSVHSPTLSTNSGVSDQQKAPTSPRMRESSTSDGSPVPTASANKNSASKINTIASRAIADGRAIGPYFSGGDNYYYNKRKDERYPRSVMCFDGAKRQTGAVFMRHVSKGHNFRKGAWVSMGNATCQRLLPAALCEPASTTASSPTGKRPVQEIPTCDNKPGQKRRAQHALFKEVDDVKRSRIDTAVGDMPLNELLVRLPSNTADMMKQLLGDGSGVSLSPVALGSPLSIVPSSPSSPSTVALSPGSGVVSPGVSALARPSSAVQRLATLKSADLKLRGSKEYNQERNSHMRVKEKLVELKRRIVSASPSKVPKYKEKIEKLERKHAKYQRAISPTIEASKAAADAHKQAKEALEKKRKELTAELNTPSILSSADLIKNLMGSGVSSSKSQRRNNTMPSGFPKNSPGKTGGSRKRKKAADAAGSRSGSNTKSPSPQSQSPTPSIAPTKTPVTAKATPAPIKTPGTAKATPAPTKTPGTAKATPKVKPPAKAKALEAAAASPTVAAPGGLPVAGVDLHGVDVEQYIHAREANLIQDDFDAFVKQGDDPWRFSMTHVNQMPAYPSDVSMAKYGVRTFRAMQNCTKMMTHTMGYMNRERFQGAEGMELVSRGMRRLKSLGPADFKAVREALWEVDSMLADMCVMSAIFWQVPDDTTYTEVAMNQLWLTRQRMSSAFHRAKRNAAKEGNQAP